MKKLAVLSAVFIVLTGFSAAETVELEIEKNPDQLAGSSSQAVLNFRYEGDQFEDRGFDPFALLLTVNHSEGDLSNEYFDASGKLSYAWAGNDYRFDLECVSGPGEVSSVGQTGAFYETSSQVVEEDQLLCLPENTLAVLRSNTVLEGDVELDFSTRPEVAPGELNITYDFGSFVGFPSFDPILEADEDGAVELEDRGIRVEDLQPGTEVGIIGYSALNVETEKPGGEDFVMNYYGFESDGSSGTLELEYSQGSLDEAEREDPRLYHCRIVEGDCVWVLVEDQSSQEGLLEAEIDPSGIYGMFTSKQKEVIVRDAGGGGDGGGSIDLADRSTDSESSESLERANTQETESTNTTALEPTASFRIDYTPPVFSENVEFNASNSYDPDGSIEEYSWSFGDSGVTAVESFDQEGNVTLTVTDSQGLQDSVKKQLECTEVSQSAFPADPEPPSGSPDLGQGITSQVIESPTSYAVLMTGLLLLVVAFRYAAAAESLRNYLN